MKTQKVAKGNEMNLSNPFAIPPCYQDIENKVEIVSFWSDYEKVSKFMETRREE